MSRTIRRVLPKFRGSIIRGFYITWVEEPFGKIPRKETTDTK